MSHYEQDSKKNAIIIITIICRFSSLIFLKMENISLETDTVNGMLCWTQLDMRIMSELLNDLGWPGSHKPLWWNSQLLNGWL